MTALQLKAVIAIAELGSITAAAKTLGISQPNASSCIRLLEEEIGYELFARGKGGAILTEKGELFLSHARQIVEENDRILAIRNIGDVYRLRVAAINYTPAFEPFLTLAEAHRNDAETDFRYFNISVAEGIEHLAKREVDIAITPVLRHQITGLMNECKHKNLRAESVCSVPAVIFVRRDHPAIPEGRLENITQGSDAMQDYPCVTIHNLFEDAGATGYHDLDYIRSAGKIIVDTAEARLRLVAATNAFAFGIRSGKGLLERYGLTAFPVPGIFLEVFALTRPGESSRREISEYMNLFREEMRQVLAD